MMWNPINILCNAITSVNNTLLYLFERYKNYFLYIFTTKKFRQKKRHCCYIHCIKEQDSSFINCHGRHIFNVGTGDFTDHLLYYCKDCPYIEREEYW